MTSNREVTAPRAALRFLGRAGWPVGHEGFPGAPAAALSPVQPCAPGRAGPSAPRPLPLLGADGGLGWAEGGGRGVRGFRTLR